MRSKGAECDHAELQGLLETGEPCALKGASTVRGGAVGKGLAEIPPERFLAGQRRKQYLACRLLYHGKWCYLYRAIDHDGNLVDSMRSRKAEHGGGSAVCASRLLLWLAWFPIRSRLMGIVPIHEPYSRRWAPM
jgi:hypothetical protein